MITDQYELLRRLDQKDRFVDRLKLKLDAANERAEGMEEVLRVAKKYIEGTGEKFSERERTPVLYQIGQYIGLDKL